MVWDLEECLAWHHVIKCAIWMVMHLIIPWTLNRPESGKMVETKFANLYDIYPLIWPHWNQHHVVKSLREPDSVDRKRKFSWAPQCLKDEYWKSVNIVRKAHFTVHVSKHSPIFIEIASIFFLVVVRIPCAFGRTAKFRRRRMGGRMTTRR